VSVLTIFHSYVELLKHGFIRTSKNKAKAAYNILLVGETGVGTTSLLKFIANVLIGNAVDDYNFEILDHGNEQGGSNHQSRTNSTPLYKLTSKNGIVVSDSTFERGGHGLSLPKVRILVMPGLTDMSQNKLHKQSTATQIRKHIDYISAVLIIANGTVSPITAGIDHALSTLSAIFPKSLASNSAFIFTNVSNPLVWNSSRDTIPSVFKNARQFHLDNPIGLQKRYLEVKDQPNMENMRTELRKHVKDGEQRALEMLVDLFKWLDDLQPIPTMKVLDLNEKIRASSFYVSFPIAFESIPFSKSDGAPNSVSMYRGRMNHISYSIVFTPPNRVTSLVQ